MRVVIVGAGVVGAATALELSRHDVDVTVLDRDRGEPRGSTNYAPGFVGVFNEAPILTELARRSAESYEPYRTSFWRRGGIELAETEEGAEALAHRLQAAAEHGVRAEFDEGTTLPSFVDETRVRAAARYPDDAVTEPAALRADIRAAAISHGARFVGDSEAVGIDSHEGGWRVRSSNGEHFDADQVILAAGIWGPGLASMVGLHLPLFPVSHPYVYAPPQRPAVAPGPFVRWPERHVYARAHNDALGIGSYDHSPILVAEERLGDGAGLPWNHDLDGVITAAQQLLRPEARFTPARRINGVFAMTPDNLPFLGAHPTEAGIWIAQAIWVTHAGGAARALTSAILRHEPTPVELAVDRFSDEPTASLRDSALTLYRDIYASDRAHPE